MNNPLFSARDECFVETSIFCNDVVRGLSAEHKHLHAKYFYDAKGDALFQAIMKCPEYYLSRCELEILKEQSAVIASKLTEGFEEFNLIELGPGDASKTVYLLHALQQMGRSFNYLPIDISKNIIDRLQEFIPTQVAGIKLNGQIGDYLDKLNEIAQRSSLPKVILFLGASIGNLTSNEALTFCKTIESLLNPNDRLLIGFDLKKNPDTTLAAYHDKGGITKAFNLNLLARINHELGANFNLVFFNHFPTYDPQTGLCRSFLISKKKQTVLIKQADVQIHFKKNEAIFMERSLKYTLKETEKLAQEANFSVENHFFDQKKWFVDSLWRKA